MNSDKSKNEVRKLEPWPRFMIWALRNSVSHPRSPLRYYYCKVCDCRIPPDATECPSCGDKMCNSPIPMKRSPIPWWGALLVMVLGISCWIIGGLLDLSSIEEVGRPLVYVPLGSIFGMSAKG